MEETHPTQQEIDIDNAYAAGVEDGKEEGAEVAYMEGFDAGYEEAITDVKAAVENL